MSNVNLKTIYRRFVVFFSENTLYPLLVFVVSRFILFSTVYVSLIVFPVRQANDLWRSFPNNLFLDGWLRWDSGWYLEIAMNGYSQEVNAAFYPLYPGLIKLIQLFVGNYAISALLVANVCFLLSLIVLYRLVKIRFNTDIAFNTITLLAFGPFSFFFSAGYSESTFLLFSILAFYFANNKVWGLAALCAGLASLTRFVGVFTVLGIAIIYLEHIEFRLSEIRLDFTWVISGSLGLVGYMLFLYFRFGDALAYANVQLSGWNSLAQEYQHLIGLANSLSHPTALLTGNYSVLLVISIISLIFTLVLLVIGNKYLPLSYIVWGIMIAIMSAIRMGSMYRYVMVIFPVYCVLAMILSKLPVSFMTWLLCLSTAFMTLFAVLFAHWYSVV